MIKTIRNIADQSLVTVNGALMGFATRETIDDLMQGPPVIIAVMVPHNIHATGRFTASMASHHAIMYPNGVLRGKDGNILTFATWGEAEKEIRAFLALLGIDQYDDQWHKERCGL